MALAIGATGLRLAAVRVDHYGPYRDLFLGDLAHWQRVAGLHRSRRK